MPRETRTKAGPFSRTRFARLYYLDKQLRSGRYPNTPVLARELEVGSRTVERDLELLRDQLGAPVRYHYQRKGYYYDGGDFKLPSLRLTEGELVALFLGQKLLAQCAGTHLEGPVRSAVEKIVALVPDGLSVDTNTLDRLVSFDVEPLRGDEHELAEGFRQLSEAIEEHASVRLKYFSASRNQTSERVVDPYHLRYFQGAWYLVAYCHWRQAFRIFALDRIREMGSTGSTYTPRTDFALHQYLGNALGIELGGEAQEVAIRFDAHQARWVRERQWHHTQRLEPQPDGTLVLTMTVSGLGEVQRWVMGFGGHAEVLRPATLRQAVAEAVKDMTVLYGSAESAAEKNI